jgi:hypothetical protein
MKKIIPALTLCFILSGCATPFNEYYNQPVSKSIIIIEEQPVPQLKSDNENKDSEVKTFKIETPH